MLQSHKVEPEIRELIHCGNVALAFSLRTKRIWNLHKVISLVDLANNTWKNTMLFDCPGTSLITHYRKAIPMSWRRTTL